MACLRSVNMRNDSKLYCTDRIPNYCKNKDIDILNFVILFAKSYIYDCKKKEMPIDLYNFQVKLKSHMVTQEYRCKVYNKIEEFESKWALLADSL